MAGVSMALNVPYFGPIITLVGYFGLLFLTSKMRNSAGGIVSFVGTVRNQARGHEIEHLEYEAYPEMAEREMQKIVDEAEQRWPGTRVAIAHRVGHLKIGDAAVVIVAAAPHRGEAFEAGRGGLRGPSARC